jgi:hypothetical protein
MELLVDGPKSYGRTVLASTAVGNFVQLITPWHDPQRSTIYLEYDGNARLSCRATVCDTWKASGASTFPVRLISETRSGGSSLSLDRPSPRERFGRMLSA